MSDCNLLNTDLDIKRAINLANVLALSQPSLTVKNISVLLQVVNNFNLVQEPGGIYEGVVVPDLTFEDFSQVDNLQVEHITLCNENDRIRITTMQHKIMCHSASPR